MNKLPRRSLEQKPGDCGVLTHPAPDFTAGSMDPDSGLYSLTDFSWCPGGPGTGGDTLAFPPGHPRAPPTREQCHGRAGLNAPPFPFLRTSLNAPITISIALFSRAPWKSRGFLRSRAAFRKDPGPPAHPGLPAALIPPARGAETELPLSSAAGQLLLNRADVSLQPSWLQFSGITISPGGGAAG